MNVDKSTICRAMREIGKVRKLDRWVPHELNAMQKGARLQISFALLERLKREPFLNRIVTCDEKWIEYDNRRRNGATSMQMLNLCSIQSRICIRKSA